MSERRVAAAADLLSWLLLAVAGTLLALGTDFEGYRTQLSHPGGGLMLERVWRRLYDLCDGSYIVWRGATWGAASLFIVWTARRLHVPAPLAAITFLAFCCVRFSEWRQSLPISMEMCAVALLATRRMGIAGKGRSGAATSLALMLMALSVPLHKGSVIVIFFALLSFIPIGRRQGVWILAVFPAVVATGWGAVTLLNAAMREWDLHANGIIRHILLYIQPSLPARAGMATEPESPLTAGIILFILSRIPALAGAVLTAIATVRIPHDEREREGLPMGRFALWILYGAGALLLLPIDRHTGWRLYGIAMFPLSIAVAQMCASGKYRKWCRVVLATQWLTAILYLIPLGIREAMDASAATELPESDGRGGRHVEGVDAVGHRDACGIVTGGYHVVGETVALGAEHDRQAGLTAEFLVVDAHRAVGERHGDGSEPFGRESGQRFVDPAPGDEEDRTHRDADGTPVERVAACRGKQNGVHSEGCGGAEYGSDVGCVGHSVDHRYA